MRQPIIEQKINELQEQLLSLGSEVEEHLLQVTDALCQQNLPLAREMVQADKWINEKRIEIGMACLQIIATQQPMARDMRQLAAMIEIVGELERIHDYVKGIGKITLHIGLDADVKLLQRPLPLMAKKTCAMLHQALSAFSARDAALARVVRAGDDIVDDHYKAIHRAVIQHVLEKPSDIEFANNMLWVGHNLERAADRVTNICEWVIYMVTGDYAELDSDIDTFPALD